MEKIKAWLKKLIDPADSYADATRQFTSQQLLALVLEELQAVRALLETADEPELVDYAVYRLLAAEQKYSYLLRQVKQERQMQELAAGL
jgi:hypothetical protein